MFKETLERFLQTQKLQDERRIKQALKEAKTRQKQEEARLKKLEDDRLKEIAELEAKQEEAKAQQLEEIKNEIAELEAKQEEIIVEQQTNEPDIIDLTEDFINFVRTGEQSISCTSIYNSIPGHLAVFLADKSRENNGIPEEVIL